MTKPTTLVLLPGLDGTEIFFRPLLATLPSSVRPLVVTYPLTGDNRYEALVRHVRATIADVPDCIVLGWSFGGPLALMVAAAEPEKVRGVILVATFVRAPRRLLTAAGFVLITPAVWLWRAFRRLPLWLLRESTDPMRRAKTETWTRVPARVLVARLRAITKVDARPVLQQCRQPMIYIASRTDAFVPARNLAEMTGLRTDLRTVTIAGRHLALYSNPAPAVAAILPFIAALERDASVTGPR